jgi:DNA-binding MarR family transcriptional regulator
MPSQNERPAAVQAAVQAAGLAADAQQFRVAIGRVARRLRRLSGDHPGEPASFTQVIVLVRLERDGALTPTELAAHEKVTTQAIAAVVRELEERGLVTRRASASDRRSSVIEITEQGRSLVRSHDQAGVAVVADAFATAFTSAEREQLHAVIPLLNRVADLI